MMIDYFAGLFGGDRNSGSEYAARRLGTLIATSDLSAINKGQFALLCHVFNGLETKPLFDAKETLLNCIHGALTEQQEYRDDITDGRFVNDRAKTKAQVLWALGAEGPRLRELIALIEKLDSGTCFALLTRIEEVLAGSGDDLTDRCAAIYEKMSGRCQL
jgi:hypothetical protein